jgi:hypothetical protein
LRRFPFSSSFLRQKRASSGVGKLHICGMDKTKTKTQSGLKKWDAMCCPSVVELPLVPPPPHVGSKSRPHWVFKGVLTVPHFPSYRC